MYLCLVFCNVYVGLIYGFSMSCDDGGRAYARRCPLVRERSTWSPPSSSASRVLCSSTRVREAPHNCYIHSTPSSPLVFLFLFFSWLKTEKGESDMIVGLFSVPGGGDSKGCAQKIRKTAVCVCVFLFLIEKNKMRGRWCCKCSSWHTRSVEQARHKRAWNFRSYARTWSRSRFGSVLCFGLSVAARRFCVKLATVPFRSRWSGVKVRWWQIGRGMIESTITIGTTVTVGFDLMKLSHILYASHPFGVKVNYIYT